MAKKSFFPKGSDLLQDVLAGLTVSFVALSLGAAFGLLSGRGAFAGMLSSALFATITSLFGGTRRQCSGPTGPMTTVTALVVAFAHEGLASQMPGINPDHFINVVIGLTGVFLLVAALLRLGKFIRFVPNVVISGFMNGIAVIIWMDQLKRLFGFGGKAAFTGPFVTNLLVMVFSALLVFLLPVFLRKIMPKYASILSATFLTIIVMTLISTVAALPIETVSLTSTIHSFGDFMAYVQGQIPTTVSWGMLWLAAPFALQLTLLAYLDTLMTSLVIDRMTGEPTKQNKELMGQGLGTLIMAFIGGIPGAQATIRSVLIVKERAVTRFAGVLVGIFALVEMLLLQNYINLIPQAVFAGILIKVGYDVFDWMPLRLYTKELFRDTHDVLHRFFSRHDDEKMYVTNVEVLMIAGTMLITVFFDLNAAVFLFTALFYLWNKVIAKDHAMRDLMPEVETEGMGDEM